MEKIISNIYLSKIKGTNIFLQNDTFLDKELISLIYKNTNCH